MTEGKKNTVNSLAVKRLKMMADGAMKFGRQRRMFCLNVLQRGLKRMATYLTPAKRWLTT